MKKKLTYISLGVIALFGSVWAVIGSFSDPLAGNRIAFESPACEEKATCAQLRSLTIADAHADTLLHRSPADKSSRGHVDLARLVVGGVDLQVFAIASFVPKLQARGDEVCGDVALGDRLVPLFVGKEPLRPSTWFSPASRVDRMIERFNDINAPAANGQPSFMPVYEFADLQQLQRLWTDQDPVVGALLAIEGFYWAAEDHDTRIRQIDVLEGSGVRMIGLTQRASNILAGSSEDCEDRGGLTEAGEMVVREIWRRGIILDLAHASSAVIADVAEMNNPGPVVVSHVGIRRSCDRDRNLSDEDVRNVARVGGVIGIGYWTWVGCWSSGNTPEAVRQKIAGQFVDAHAILSAPDFVAEMGDGYDPTHHLGLGSDFDGGTTMPVATDGVPWILEAIARAESGGRPVFDEVALRNIAGENLLRILQAALEVR